jgi:hypothetical protein
MMGPPYSKAHLSFIDYAKKLRFSAEKAGAGVMINLLNQSAQFAACRQRLVSVPFQIRPLPKQTPLIGGSDVLELRDRGNKKWGQSPFLRQWGMQKGLWPTAVQNNQKLGFWTT